MALSNDSSWPPSIRHFSVAALLLANFIPLSGVIYWGWKISDIMLLFWCENIIIGVMNVLRMTLWGILHRKLAQAIPLSLFFAVHYGIFTLVHGMFVAQFFVPDTQGIAAGMDNWLHTDGIPLAITGLVASHFFSLISNFLGRGEVRQVTLKSLMAAPYGRIIMLHLTIIFGAFLVLSTGNALWSLLLLTILKTVIDLVSHLKEHWKFQRKDMPYGV